MVTMGRGNENALPGVVVVALICEFRVRHFFRQDFEIRRPIPTVAFVLRTIGGQTVRRGRTSSCERVRTSIVRLPTVFLRIPCLRGDTWHDLPKLSYSRYSRCACSIVPTLLVVWQHHSFLPKKTFQFLLPSQRRSDWLYKTL